MSKILKAKPVLKQIYSDLKEVVSALTRVPSLKIIMLGSDPAAEWYIDNIQKQSEKYGLKTELMKFSTILSQMDFENIINRLNEDPEIDGIMIQKPLPDHLDEKIINSLIDPDKDVDGFHPQNLGKLMLEQDALFPCTPQAVIEVLKYYQISVSGKRVVILGRSSIVGKPLSMLFLNKSEWGNATVTVCHSKTKNLAEITREADILIAAIGKAHFVNSEMIKKGAVVIDVGTNLINDPQKGNIYVGDVDTEAVIDKVSAITPVPGGVGSITTALLLTNLVKAAKLDHKK